MIQNIKISRLLKNIFFVPLKSTIHEIKQAIYKFKYDYVPLGLDKDFDLSTVKTVLIDRLDGKLGDTVCVLPFLKHSINIVLMQRSTFFQIMLFTIF
jgi:hypothetical protein